MTDKAYAVPLHELLAGVPREARLVIDDDGMGTRFIPVGRYCNEAAEALRARLAQPEQQHSEQWWRHEVSNAWAEGYEKGRTSVKQPEQEPVWVEVTTNTGDKFILDSAVEADKIRAARDAGLSVVPLYTAPPQREWQGLTDEEIIKLQHLIDWTAHWSTKKFAHAIEAKLKEKNA